MYGIGDIFTWMDKVYGVYGNGINGVLLPEEKSSLTRNITASFLLLYCGFDSIRQLEYSSCVRVRI